MKFQVHHGLPFSGYGIMGYEIARGLEREGHQVVERGAPVRIYALPPYCIGQKELWPVPGQYNVCVTMFEASRIPEMFQECLDNYDLLIVPNKLNLEQFSRYHPSVVQVPLGIGAQWTIQPRPVKDRFRFLYMGLGERKGEDLVHRAFDDAFSDISEADKPLLTTFRGAHTPEEEIIRIYHGCQAFIAPRRGDAWDLLAFQAVATGMPCVLTDNPGHREFAFPGHPMVPTTPSDSIIGGSRRWSGQWWEPDYDKLVAAIRSIWDHYDDYAADARRSAKIVHANMRWDDTAARIVEHTERWDGPPVIGTPVTPKLRLFPAQVSKPVVRADIYGTIYNLEPGEHQLPAQVLRVLCNAGYIEGDPGYWERWS